LNAAGAINLAAYHLPEAGISDQNRPNQFELTTRANAANGLLHCKW
jgi:hypothetical protein